MLTRVLLVVAVPSAPVVLIPVRYMRYCWDINLPWSIEKGVLHEVTN